MRRTARRLDQAYEKALCIPIGMGSRIVLMSDCHRGVGTWGDNFQANQNLFLPRCNIIIEGTSPILNLGMGMSYGKTGTCRRLCGYTATNSG